MNAVERGKHHSLKDGAASVCGSGDGSSPSVTNSSGSVVSAVAAPRLIAPARSPAARGGRTRGSPLLN